MHRKLWASFLFCFLFPERCQDSSLAFNGKYPRPLRRKTEQRHNWVSEVWRAVIICVWKMRFEALFALAKGTQRVAEKGGVVKKRIILCRLLV